MKRFLLDTNHLGECIGRVSSVRDRIQQMRRQGNVFGTCGPVLCELLVGVELRKDATNCRRRLDELLQVVRVWPIDLSISEHYAKVYHQLKNAECCLSQVDMIVAALARQFDAVVLTTDQDFQALVDIKKEDWLALPQS